MDENGEFHSLRRKKIIAIVISNLLILLDNESCEISGKALFLCGGESLGAVRGGRRRRECHVSWTNHNLKHELTLRELIFARHKSATQQRPATETSSNWQ